MTLGKRGYSSQPCTPQQSEAGEESIPWPWGKGVLLQNRANVDQNPNSAPDPMRWTLLCQQQLWDGNQSHRAGQSWGWWQHGRRPRGTRGVRRRRTAKSPLQVETNLQGSPSPSSSNTRRRWSQQCRQPAPTTRSLPTMGRHQTALGMSAEGRGDMKQRVDI